MPHLNHFVWGTIDGGFKNRGGVQTSMAASNTSYAARMTISGDGVESDYRLTFNLLLVPVGHIDNG